MGESESEQDKSDTCSSSDQGERMSLGRGEEETNSEAEPAEEREEMGGGEGETDSPVSVQSSEERSEMDSLLDEPRGAADSSDEISGVVTPSPAVAAEEREVADQPSCSEGELGNSTDKEEVGEGNSPDQSDTAQ